MSPIYSRALSATLFACFLIGPAGAGDWVEESDRHAQVLLEVMARFAPEQSGQIGVEGLDEEIVDWKPGFVERGNAATVGAISELGKRLTATSDPLVRQDLEILIQAGELGIRGAELNEQYLLPYFNVSQLVFNGVRSLLDAQVAEERRGAAVVRLRRYAGIENGYEPIVELAMARTRERFDQGLLGPFRGEVEQGLANSERFLAGMRQMLQASALDGWEEPMEVLEGQIAEYDEWVREQLLPRARTDHRLPPELYAFNLQQVGVAVAPEDLIRTARIAYMEIRNEMQALAPLVARERDLEVTDYRDVMRALKAEQLVGDEILAFYRETMRTLQEIVIREGIVSIPERDAVVRLATEAESAQIPAPFLQPPRLVGNTGEYPEFVLPLSVPPPPGQEALKLDDFTHRAVAWSLSVHEARPGHELQFATMVEQGVSTARAVFAFNSVNVEGWALYAEAVMKPYMPLDGQLFSLQLRLMRAARAFLDPMVNLGLITPAEVQRFLEEEVVLSPAMADSEVRRYTFMAPGQATAYFYGYTQLMAMRAEAELELGDRFDRKAFHDFILSQGMLPPNLLEKAVREDFVRSRLVASN